MSRGGVAVDRVVACPGIGSGQAADTLVSIVGASGDYHTVRVASDRLQFARTFRPTWATVTGWLTLVFALVGVVFFFVKTTETCVAVIEADHRGTRVRLSGRLDAEVLQRLLAAFDDPAGAARDAAAASAVGAPVDSANPTPPSFPSSVPTMVPAAASAPVPMPVPMPMPVSVPSAPPSGAPMIVQSSPPAGPPVPMAPPAGAPTPVPTASPAGAPVPMAPPAATAAPPPGPVPIPPPEVPSSGPPYPPVAQPASSSAGAGVASGPVPSFPPSSFDGPTPGRSPASASGWVPVWERDDPQPAEPASGPGNSALGFDPSSTIIVPKQRNGGATVLRAVLDDGTELDLSTVVLLGRDPAAGGDDHGAALVPVADPERTVSKTHLKVEVLGGLVLATDRGSTNGSVLVTSDGAETELDPGVPTEVPAGCAVRFGTRTVRVLSTGAIGAPL